jgi:hypothetical protein
VGAFVVLLGDGGTNAPDGKGYTKIYSNTYAFAATPRLD